MMKFGRFATIADEEYLPPVELPVETPAAETPKLSGGSPLDHLPPGYPLSKPDPFFDKVWSAAFVLHKKKCLMKGVINPIPDTDNYCECYERAYQTVLADKTLGKYVLDNDTLIAELMKKPITGINELQIDFSKGSDSSTMSFVVPRCPKHEHQPLTPGSELVRLMQCRWNAGHKQPCVFTRIPLSTSESGHH